MILHGDSLEKLKELKSDSVDFVCTDPPYGIGFMGKAWDTFKPEYVDKTTKRYHEEVNEGLDKRITKKIGSAAEMAGSYDNTLKGRQSFQQFIHEISIECLRVLKPGAFMCMTMSPRQDVLSRCMIAIEDAGFNTGFTSIYWTFASGFPKAGNIGKLVDKRNGVQGEVIGQGKAGSGMNKVKGFGTNTTKAGEATTEWDVHKVVSDLDGSYAGFQPKPAVEVIIVAMKPLSEKTYVDQALTNGKGISWLDDARIPTDQAWTPHIADDIRGGNLINSETKNHPTLIKQPHEAGRFPANLLVSDDVLNDGVERKTGSLSKRSVNDKNGWGFKEQPINHTGDSGSYSRYFDLDKWASTLPFLIVPKASKTEKNKGLETFDEVIRSDRLSVETIGANNPRNRTGTAKKNHHPTVKPLKLISYLITLFSREGDTVLDPFVGSGTTCLAAKKLNRKCIGIEREAEYVEIANARLNADKQEMLL